MNEKIFPVITNKSSVFPASKFINAHILVVDDAPFNVKLICSVLHASGYKNVSTAVDGVDALKQTYRSMPDLVLLDIMMPNMDGFEYCEQIRNDPSAAHMPIIVQTALEDRDTKIRALSIGADDFINKPLDLEEVALRVHVHLERYFMLQDAENIRGYLQMELEQAQTTIEHLEKVAMSMTGRHLLEKHYDVLKSLARNPQHY